jgi:hypothetical protein
MPAKRSKNGIKKGARINRAPKSKSLRKTVNLKVVQRGRSNRPPREVTKSGRVTVAPSQVGMVMPRAKFQFSGKAQTHVDYDSDNSLRICGTDLFANAVQAGSSDAKAGLGATAGYYRNLSPSLISARLANAEAMFQFYAIRRLRIHYVPTVGTGTGVSVALAVVADTTINADFTTPTQQQVIEFSPSLITPVWSVSTLDYKHTGTKLWEAYASGTGALAQVQAFLCATLLGASTSVVYGQLWMEYEIDFYQPSPVINPIDYELRSLTPVPLKRQARIQPPLDHEGKEESKDPQPVFSDPDDFVISPPPFRPLSSGPNVPGTPNYVPSSKPPSRK